MTSRRRRQVAAAAELNRLRRPLEHVDLPDPRDPSLRHRVDGFILEYHRHRDLGLPTSDEYSVTGWLAAIADRAQDFEQGTVYLATATGAVGTAGWSATARSTVQPPSSQAPARTGIVERSAWRDEHPADHRPLRP